MRVEMLPIEVVEFDFENPRLANFLEYKVGELTADDIAFALDDSGDGTTSLRQLREAIKKQGGLINPIIVNQKPDGRYVAIEGNTRLKIYQEFHEKGQEGDWTAIPAVVHSNLDRTEIHGIRLQAHLVGPREWSPYAKAKYLYQLSHNENMTEAQIFDYCGGTTSRAAIESSIDAYEIMERNYRQLTGSDDRFDHQKFSHFQEYVKTNLKGFLNSFDLKTDDFCEWVISGKVDTAQRVRDIKKVFGSNSARSEFLNNPAATVKSAMSIVSAETIISPRGDDLASLSLEQLSLAINEKILSMPYEEVRALRRNMDADIVETLTSLRENINDFFEDIGYGEE